MDLYHCFNKLFTASALMDRFAAGGDPMDGPEIEAVRLLLNAAKIKIEYYDRKYNFAIDDEDMFYTEDFEKFMYKASRDRKFKVNINQDVYKSPHEPTE